MRGMLESLGSVEIRCLRCGEPYWGDFANGNATCPACGGWVMATSEEVAAANAMAQANAEAEADAEAAWSQQHAAAPAQVSPLDPYHAYTMDQARRLCLEAMKAVGGVPTAIYRQWEAIDTLPRHERIAAYRAFVVTLAGTAP